jgi:hypothetical protein
VTLFDTSSERVVSEFCLRFAVTFSRSASKTPPHYGFTSLLLDFMILEYHIDHMTSSSLMPSLTHTFHKLR